MESRNEEKVKKPVGGNCRDPKFWVRNKRMWVANTKQDAWVSTILDKDFVVFEWGSGGSTFFFADRVKKITTVEHNGSWNRIVSDAIKKDRYKNIKLHVVNVKKYPGGITNKTFIKAYTYAITVYPDEYDIIYVDGLPTLRSLCVRNSIKYLKPGGWVLVDNMDQKIQNPEKIWRLLGKWECKQFSFYTDGFTGWKKPKAC